MLAIGIQELSVGNWVKVVMVVGMLNREVQQVEHLALIHAQDNHIIVM